MTPQVLLFNCGSAPSQDGLHPSGNAHLHPNTIVRRSAHRTQTPYTASLPRDQKSWLAIFPAERLRWWTSERALLFHESSTYLDTPLLVQMESRLLRRAGLPGSMKSLMCSPIWITLGRRTGAS